MLLVILRIRISLLYCQSFNLMNKVLRFDETLDIYAQKCIESLNL